MHSAFRIFISLADEFGIQDSPLMESATFTEGVQTLAVSSDRFALLLRFATYKNAPIHNPDDR